MPRYFFHVFDGLDIPDRDGTELPDLQGARQTALRYAGEIMSNRAFSQALGELWHMEVADALGSIYFRLDFHVTDVPVQRSDRTGSGR